MNCRKLTVLYSGFSDKNISEVTMRSTLKILGFKSALTEKTSNKNVQFPELFLTFALLVCHFPKNGQSQVWNDMAA